MNDDLEIRWMQLRDVKEVLKLEDLCQGDPLLDQELLDSFADDTFSFRVAATKSFRSKIIGMLCCANDDNYVEIMRLSVHPGYRRQAVGTSLILSLQSRGSWGQFKEVRAVVREHDVRSQLFLKSCGLQWVETGYDWYSHPIEDAYTFETVKAQELANGRADRG